MWSVSAEKNSSSSGIVFWAKKYQKFADHWSRNKTGRPDYFVKNVGKSFFVKFNT
jgi:hypothetical protein